MKKTKEFFINKQRIHVKDFLNLKIFHIKKMILFSLDMVVFIKFLVKFFVNGTELNPNNMP